MIVSSAIELYTTLLGWHLYNGIWGLLVSTGLVLLPFLIAVISILIDVAGQDRATASLLIRSLETKLYLMLGVLFFCVQPHINLYLENAKFSKSSCPENGAAAVVDEKSFGDTGTTYDLQAAQFEHMMDGRIAQIPVWWYFFTRLSYAITNSLKHEIPCKADIRSVMTNLADLKISDPLLKDEARQFYQDCYLPAANKYMRLSPEKKDIPSAYRDNITNDVAWMGSDYFVTQPGYYDQLRPSTPVKAIPYSKLRGDDVKGPDLEGTALSPGPGWPTCDAWWKDKDGGLRQRLLANVKGSEGMGDALPTYNAVSSDWFSTKTQSDNALLQNAIAAPGKRESLAISNNLSANGSEVSSFVDGVAQAMQQDAAQLSLAYGSIKSTVETHALKSAAPIIQSIIIMVLTFMLPIILFFSLWDLSTLVITTVVYFTFIFWSFLFALAYWLDNFLLGAVMDQSDANVINHFFSAQNTDILVITWITRFAYVGLPIIFTSLFGLAGRRLATSLNGRIDDLGGSVSGAASKNIPFLK